MTGPAANVERMAEIELRLAESPTGTYPAGWASADVEFLIRALDQALAVVLAQQVLLEAAGLADRGAV